MKTQKNWLIDTNLSDGCTILRIIEFDLKLLDCSKKHTIWTWVAKTNSNCKVPILLVGWSFNLIQCSFNKLDCLRTLNGKSGKTGVYTHLIFAYNNSNSSNMTQVSIILLNKNSQWAITLWSNIHIWATVLVFLHRYRLQWRKINYSK